jgi:hypothetical protein
MNLLLNYCLLRNPGDRARLGANCFRMEDGVGSLTGVWAARPQASQGLENYSTVEKFFAVIGEELAKRRYRVEIEYDPDLGYPRRFYIKRFENAGR